MVELMLILQLRGLTKFTTSQDRLLINLGEHPANPFQAQRISQKVNDASLGVVKFCRSVHVTHLGRLVDGLDIDADALRVVRVFTVVAVEVGDPLLEAALSLPEPNEGRNFLLVLKGNVVDVAVLLPVQNYGWRRALVAHAFWVRRVPLLALKVDFVRDVLTPSAILALLARSVFFGTSLPHLLYKRVEGHVFEFF